MQVENDILLLGKSLSAHASITFPSFFSIFIFSVAKDREPVTVDQVKKRWKNFKSRCRQRERNRRHPPTGGGPRSPPPSGAEEDFLREHGDKENVSGIFGAPDSDMVEGFEVSLPEMSKYHMPGLSQQGIWVSFWTPKPLKRIPQDTPKEFVRNFLKCQSYAYN